MYAVRRWRIYQRLGCFRHIQGDQGKGYASNGVCDMEEGVGSLGVWNGQAWGIVYRRDLSCRVVSECAC